MAYLISYTHVPISSYNAYQTKRLRGQPSSPAWKKKTNQETRKGYSPTTTWFTISIIVHNPLTPSLYIKRGSPVPLSKTPYIKFNLTFQSHPVQHLDRLIMYFGEKMSMGLSEEERFQRDEIAPRQNYPTEPSISNTSMKTDQTSQNGERTRIGWCMKYCLSKTIGSRRRL